jgi:hypothetical protein
MAPTAIKRLRVKSGSSGTSGTTHERETPDMEGRAGGGVMGIDDGFDAAGAGPSETNVCGRGGAEVRSGGGSGVRAGGVEARGAGAEERSGGGALRCAGRSSMTGGSAGACTSGVVSSGCVITTGSE